jgi:hypothetical protein
MREAVIERYLVKRVIALGGEVRKVQWVGRRGAPDRVVMLPPFRLEDRGASAVAAEWMHKATKAVARELGWRFSTTWVELKAPGKKAEPHQEREHERMRAMGQHVVVLDSIEAVDQFIEGML